MSGAAQFHRDIDFYCVLKHGKKYGPLHVEKLKAAVERNCSHPFSFRCLSDVDVPCERIPLEHDWPGFWSKVELFRPGVTDLSALNVYIDLDVLVTGSLDRLVDYPHRFSMLRNDCFPERANSSVMAWTGDHSDIYERMKAHPVLMRTRYCSLPWYGDQALIESCLREKNTPPDYIDDILGSAARVAWRMKKDDDLDDVLFVSFQGHLAKPGSAALADDPLVQKYW